MLCAGCEILFLPHVARLSNDRFFPLLFLSSASHPSYIYPALIIISLTSLAHLVLESHLLLHIIFCLLPCFSLVLPLTTWYLPSSDIYYFFFFFSSPIYLFIFSRLPTPLSSPSLQVPKHQMIRDAAVTFLQLPKSLPSCVFTVYPLTHLLPYPLIHLGTPPHQSLLPTLPPITLTYQCLYIPKFAHPRYCTLLLYSPYFPIYLFRYTFLSVIVAYFSFSSCPSVSLFKIATI